MSLELSKLATEEEEAIECQLESSKERKTAAIISQFGFAADPAKSVHENACIHFGQMPTWQYFARPTNLSFHDLTDDDTEKPTNIRSLLGLGLKFIPIPRTTPKWGLLQSMTIDRIDRDMQLKCYFAGSNNTFEGDLQMYI